MCSGLAWKSHSCPTIWQLGPPSPLCLLACVVWFGLAAPLLTSTAERTVFQGFGTTSTTRAGLSSAQHTTQRRARDDAVATGLETDLLPRSGLCSPSPMAQAEPSMAADASYSQSAWLLSFSRDQGCQGALSLSHPPSRSSSSSRCLSRVAVCGERPCR
jgi:hypothetical protein